MTALAALAALGGAAAIGTFCYWQNNFLSETYVEIRSPKISRRLRILHLSDLHTKRFGKDNRKLLDKAAGYRPDLIAVTGDIVGRYAHGYDHILRAMGELAALAPTYYVSGNHEYGRADRETLFAGVRERGVILLRHETAETEIAGQRLELLGLDEMGYRFRTPEILSKFQKKQGFKLLLSHFPERFSEEYRAYDIDLVLSGHAHGGQVILPWIGGVFSPGQGFFPKYYRGLYEENGRKLVVSRGLGNSGCPLRLFNPPDMVVIDLMGQDPKGRP